MASHSSLKFIISKPFLEIEDSVESENPNLIFMICIWWTRSRIKACELIWHVSADLSACETVFSLDEILIQSTCALHESIQFRIDISNQPMKPTKSTYRNCIIVLHNKCKGLYPFWNARPRNWKRKGWDRIFMFARKLPKSTIHPSINNTRT